jgi:membrane dipeptidase
MLLATPEESGMGMNRRHWLQSQALACGAWMSSLHTAGALAQTATPAAPPASASAGPLIADLHSHLGIIDRQNFATDLAADMRSHRAGLVCWKIVADGLWIRSNAQGIYQSGTPTPQELWEYFERVQGRLNAYLRSQKLDVALTAAHVDAASQGTPHVVLASEGADFLGGQIGKLKTAFDAGLRHLQLVHYIRNPVGDFQTESPTHGGLTSFGREVIQACESLGILVDCAHLSSQALTHALETATKPMVWSHGWVEGRGGSPSDTFGYAKRRLSVDQAKRIAAKGGVIGLWGLGLDRPGYGWTAMRQDRASYAKELAKLVQLVGEDHAALGTDLAGVSSNWTVAHYGHVRETLDRLKDEKLSDAVIEKVAFGNAARVLKANLPKA